MPVSGPTGAMSPPSPNPGAMADSLSKVGIAVKILSEALPALPVGDDIQKAVLDSIQKLSKIAPASAQVPGVQATQLRGLENQAQSTAMLSALMRALQAPAQGQPPAGAPPMAAPRPALPGPGGAGPMM